MLKKIIIFFSIFFSLVGLSHSNEKIVFIDINFIFSNSIAGKDLNKKISEKNEKLKLEIIDFKKKIDDDRSQILSQKNVLSEEEYNIKIDNLEKKIKQINSTISKKNEELRLYKIKVENIFSKNLNLIIEQYSVENSINIILNKDNLLMAKKELDITQKVLALFNEKINKLSIN